VDGACNGLVLKDSLLPADLQASIEEARYALDVLKADGVVLLGNARGRYFAEQEFHPLLAELNRRGAVLYCHPNFLSGGVQPGMPPFVAGVFPLALCPDAICRMLGILQPAKWLCPVRAHILLPLQLGLHALIFGLQMTSNVSAACTDFTLDTVRAAFLYVRPPLSLHAITADVHYFGRA
jgi:hypothetical protein